MTRIGCPSASWSAARRGWGWGRSGRGEKKRTGTTTASFKWIPRWLRRSSSGPLALSVYTLFPGAGMKFNRRQLVYLLGGGAVASALGGIRGQTPPATNVAPHTKALVF